MTKHFTENTVHNRQELLMLILTSFQAFFIGAFVALFMIGSQVLFFQSWDATKLPMAFTIAGILGTGLFALYSLLVTRISFRLFSLLFLVLIFAINAALFAFYDGIAHFGLAGIPLLMPFTVSIPISFITLILFRRSVSNLLSGEQHRRIHPVIRFSLIAGMVVSSYLLVAALFISFDILLIIAASAVCIGLAAFLQLPVNFLHRNSGFFPHTPRRATSLRSKFYEFLYTRYTVLLLVFVILSAVIGFLIQYHFLSQTRLNYPNTIGLAKFLGFFTGTMVLFVYVVEKLLLRKILYAYDSPFSLVLIPVVLALTAVASLLVDLLAGQSNAFARFSFGFLMVAMLRIGYETANEAIELPSLRVLFRTLDLRFIGSVHTRLEGSFRMIALLLAGLLLAGLLSLNLDKNIFINLLILLLALGWIPVGVILIKKYQQALRDYIRRLKTFKKTIEQELLNIDEKSHSLINSRDPGKSVLALSILERIEPLSHEKHLLSLLGNESPLLRKYILERIDNNALLSALPKMKELQRTETQKHSNGHLGKLISRFEIKINAGSTKAAIENLVNSGTLTDRILAAEIIGNSGNQAYGDLLLMLSRDFEPEVKYASIKAIARMGNPNHSYVLIGFLTTPAYYPYAFEALVKIGDPGLPYMEEMFLLPETDNILLSRIVRIYGKIGTPAAIDLLLSKIENQNRTISRQALLALREAKFQATPGNINRILNDIVRLINTMSWNFAAYSGIMHNNRVNLLKDAMRTEIQENYTALYLLLSLAYNPTSIGNIKNMLVEGSDTDISFAIELLDQIVNEEIKQVFFPVMENIPVKERFKQLQYFFQANKENPEVLVQEIITRDYNQISLYVKACALMSILKLPIRETGQEVISCIFHPNQLLWETAAYVLEKTEPGKIESVYTRLEHEQVNELKSMLNNVGKGIPTLLIDRIRFIKKCRYLSHISEDVLLEISRALIIHQMKAGEEFLVKREDVHFAFMIVIEGTAQINISSGKVLTFDKNDIIYSDLFVEENTYLLRALTDLKFYSLEQEVLNALMFDYIDFRDTVLEIVEEA